MEYTRTNVYLTNIQREQLKLLSSQLGPKPAELMRRAIDEFVKRNLKKESGK